MKVGRLPLLCMVALSLTSVIAAPADSGRLVRGAAWEYRFPPGLLDPDNLAITPDFRYLAIVSGRWTYHPKDKPDEATSEGENAVYVFDLRQKQLLWKQVLPEAQAPRVIGISPAAEFTAIQVNPGWYGWTRRWERDGQKMEGVQLVGPQEPGVRLYDRHGTLVATRVPLEGIGPRVRQHRGPLVRRSSKEGEEPVSGELQQALAGTGIGEVAVVPPRELITTRSRDGVPYVVGLEEDGTVRWEWPIPAHERSEDSRVWPISLSPDGECAVAGYPIAGPGAHSRTMRFHFFRRADGWHWSRDFPRGMPWTTSWEVSNGGRSVLIKRDQGDRSTVDVLGPDGQTKSQHTFYIFGIWSSVELSPNGRYWAAVIGHARDEATAYAGGRGMGGQYIPPPPRIDESAWTDGLHVVDCDTGKVVWHAPLPPPTALEFIALDSGGVVAISKATHTLAVFDPPSGPPHH